jgi:hypothetical protein
MTKRRLITKLPGVLQTPDLKKFFSSTVDQVFQPGETQSVNAFVGKKPAYFNASKDFYKVETTREREFYQLEPAMTTTAPDGSFTDLLFYQDTVNNLRFQGADVSNESRLFNTDFYSWCPPVNVSKLERYRDYFWLPEGPPVLVFDILTGGDETLEYVGDDYKNNFPVPNSIPGTKVRVRVAANGVVVDSSKYDLVNGQVIMKLAPVKGTVLTVRTLGGYLVTEHNGVRFNRFQLPKVISASSIYNLVIKVNDEVIENGYILDGNVIDGSIVDGNILPGRVDGNVLTDYQLINNAVVFDTPLNVNDVVEIWVNGDFVQNIQGKEHYVHPVFATAYATEHATEQYLDEKGEVQIREIIKQFPEKVIPSPPDLSQDMRVQIIDNNGTIMYRVTRVDGKLLLVPEDDTITLRIKEPQYITIERGAKNNNGWSLANNWYHRSTLIYADPSYQPGQAIRPIVEYFNTILLLNNGVNLLDTVDAVYDAANESKSLSVMQNNLIEFQTVQGKDLVDGMKVLVINSQEAQFQNRILKVNEIVIQTPYDEGDNFDNSYWDGAELLDFSIQEPAPHYLDQVKTTKPDATSVNLVEYWFNGSTWKKATTFNYQEPLFDLFDGGGKSLQTYPLNNFDGSKLFTYERSQGNPDSILGFPAKRNKYMQFEFRDHLATDVWTTDDVEITGYKYFARSSVVNGLVELVYRSNWHVAGTTAQRKINGFYEIPKNLQANATSQEVNLISANDWQTQFKALLANSDWLLDSSEFKLSAGNSIIQSRGTMLKAMLLNADTTLDFTKATSYVEHEYIRYRNKFVQLLKQYEVQNNLMNVESGVQGILKQLKSAKTIDFPFYNNGVVGEFFIPATAAYLGMTPLWKPEMTLEVGRAGSIILIRGHDGSVISGFTRIPSKTAKLKNGVIFDGQDVISIDNKDLALFNLENKIYDSALGELKSQRRPVFDLTSYVSGKFRKAEYSHDEITNITRPMFERWSTKMNLDYRTNTNFDAANPFTYNYSDLLDIDGNEVPGFWRGMYQYYFDTDRPHTHPWEMLGFTSKPTWWDGAYSWTDSSKRQALVAALTMGLVTRPGAIPVIDATFARAEFSRVNPVGVDGSLLDPFTAGIVVNNGVVDFSKDWVFGDVGPVEYQWKTSQSCSFNMAHLSYLTKPVHFIESTWETADEVEIHGYDWVSRVSGKRKQVTDYQIHNEIVNGKASRVLGMQMWLSDYLRSSGKDVSVSLGNRVRALGANLAHKLGGFMDQASLKTFTENSGLIPQEDVKVLTYNSPSIREEFYGGVVITWTGESWKVIGYDVTKQSFSILPVDEAGNRVKVALDGYTETFANDWHQNTYYQVNVLVQWKGTNYRCAKTHTSGRAFEAEYWTADSIVNDASTNIATYYLEHFNEVQTIPYGYEMYSHQEVVNFLSGYEAYLQSRGWDFEYLDESDNEIRDFKFSAKEFLAWSQVKWADNTFIALSPSFKQATYKTQHGNIQPVDQLINGSYAVLSKEGSAIEKSKITADRTDIGITVQVTDAEIYGLRLSINEVEQVIVFKNTTTFNDVIFQPLFDVRQNRIRIVALLSTEWTGKLDAPGFVITDNRLMPSFEKQVEDIRYMYDIEKAINLPLRDNARHQIGYQSRPYLENLMYNEVNQFEFYQGMIQQKGAPGVFEKLLRNDDLTQSQELNFLEEWAFLKGQYGGVSQDSTFEIELARPDILAEPQMIRFTEAGSFYDLGDFDTDTMDGIPPVVPANFDPEKMASIDPDDTVIEMYNLAGKWDGRIVRPFTDGAPFTSVKKYTREMNDLPNAGYVRLNETDWQSMNFASFANEIKLSGNDLIVGQRLWIYENADKRWSMFRACSASSDSIINEVKAFYPDDNGVMLQMTHTPNVVAGESVYLNKVINDNSNLGGMVKVLFVDFDLNQVIIDADVINKHEYTDTVILPQMIKLVEMRARITNPALVPLLSNKALTMLEVTSLGIKTPVGGFINGEKIYIDVGFEIQSVVASDAKQWKVFAFDSISNTFTTARIQPQRLRSDLIKDAKVYDLETTVTKTALTVKPLLNGNVIIFDPCKGLIPGVADKEIWYKLEYDPAAYNNGLGITSQGSDWGQAEVGRLWWNVSAVRFLQTETDDLDNPTISVANAETELSYRRNHWGQLAPNTSVDIYEWTQSRITPLEWIDKVAKGDNPDQYDGEVLNATEPSWVESEIWDDKLATMVPVYYFWVKGRKIIPQVDFRNASAANVASIISNPESAGVAWMSPISRNAFLVDGITQYLNSTSSLEIRVARTDAEVARHVEWSLMRNGDERSQPSRDLWDKITKSLSTRTATGEILPDMRRYVTDRIGFDVENGQVMFSNIANARKHLMQYLNKVFAGILLVDERRDIPTLLPNDSNVSTMQWYQKDNSFYQAPYPITKLYDSKFSSYEEFQTYLNKPGNSNKVGLVSQTTDDHTFWSLLTGVKEGNVFVPKLWTVEQYSVANMAERDARIGKMKVGEMIKVAGTTETGGFWTLWKLNSAKKFDLVSTQRYNTSEMYSMVDWYAPGYTLKDEPTSAYATTLDRDQQLGIDPLTPLVKVLNDGKGRWMWTLYQDGRWHTVAKQRGTISLKDSVWMNTGNYLPDAPTALPSNYKNLVANRDMGYELAAFMNVLRDDILTPVEVNNLFFTMINYVHTEQNYVDWCFKTSFMYVTGYTERLLQDPIALSDRTGNLLSYIKEVKPYHVKIRDFASKYGVSDTAKVRATDFDFPAYFDPTLKVFRQLNPNNRNDLAIIETGVWNAWWQQYQHNDNQLVRKLNLTSKYFDEAKVDVQESVRLRVKRRGDVGAPTTNVNVVKRAGTMNVTMSLVAQTQSAIAAFADGLRVDPSLVTFDAAKSRVTAPVTGNKFEVMDFSYGSNGLIREIKYFTKTSSVNVFDLGYKDLVIAQLMVTVDGKEVTNATMSGSKLTVPTNAGNGLVQVAILNEKGRQFKRITTSRFTKAQFNGKNLNELYAPLKRVDRLPVMNNFVIEVDGLRKMTEMIYNVNINSANQMIRIERPAPVNELVATLDEKPVVIGTKLSRRMTILQAEREVALGQHPQVHEIHVTDLNGIPLIVGEVRGTLIPIDEEHPQLFPTALQYDIDVYDDEWNTWDGVVAYTREITWDYGWDKLENVHVNWEVVPEAPPVFNVVPENADLVLYEGHLVRIPRMYADMEIIVTIDNHMPNDFSNYQWVPQSAPFVMVNDMISATTLNAHGHLTILDKKGGEFDLDKTVLSQFPNAQLITITDIVDSDMGSRTFTFHNIEQSYFPINQRPANDAALWVNLNGRRLTHKEDFIVIESNNQEWDEFVWELDAFEEDNYQLRGNTYKDDLDFDTTLVWGDAADEYDNGEFTTLAIKLLVDPKPDDILIATVFAAKQANAAREFEIFAHDKKAGKEVREITEGDRYSLVKAINRTSTAVTVVQRPGPYTRDVITAQDFDARLWVDKDLLKVNTVNAGTLNVSRNQFITEQQDHVVMADADAPQVVAELNVVNIDNAVL